MKTLFYSIKNWDEESSDEEESLSESELSGSKATIGTEGLKSRKKRRVARDQ